MRSSLALTHGRTRVELSCRPASRVRHCSVDDRLDGLLHGARLLGAAWGTLPGLEELLAEVLQLLAAESLAHLREPVLPLLLHVVLDVLHEHRRLGGETLVGAPHRGELHTQ